MDLGLAICKSIGILHGLLMYKSWYFFKALGVRIAVGYSVGGGPGRLSEPGSTVGLVEPSSLFDSDGFISTSSLTMPPSNQCYFWQS